MNREQRRRLAGRRRAIVGLSTLAASGLLTAYVQRPLAAYAATSCVVQTEQDDAGTPAADSLRDCINRINSGGGDGTITFAAAVDDILLDDQLPVLTGSVRIDGGSGVVLRGGGPTSNFRALEAVIPNESLAISDVTFRDFHLQQVGAAGGVIQVDGRYATVNLDTSTFLSNDVGDGKGTVFIGSDDVTLNFSGVRADDNSAGQGGFLFSTLDAEITISNSTFTRNESSSEGGAFYITGGSIDISDSSFDSNTAGYTGGAVHIEGDSVFAISDSTFVGNSSVYRASVIGYAGDTTVTNSTFTDNSGPSMIWSAWGDLTLNFVTIAANSTTDAEFGTGSSTALTVRGSALSSEVDLCGPGVAAATATYALG